MAGGAREKALQMLKEVPRLSKTNLGKLPWLPRTKKRGYGQRGKERGWGASARQKMEFGPLGSEGGATPIQRVTSFERSYNYGLHAIKQFPCLTLQNLQLALDTSKFCVLKCCHLLLKVLLACDKLDPDPVPDPSLINIINLFYEYFNKKLFLFFSF